MRSPWWIALIPVFLLPCACTRSEAGSKVVLRLATWGGAGDDNEFTRTIQAIYREFEAENPGVELRVEGIPGSQEYVSKMLLNFVADAAADVMMLDASSAALFIDNRVLLDLAPLAERDPDFSFDDFFPNVVDIARRGEAIYAAPGDFTPMVLYYNKKLFDQAGVPYPQPGWTWDDFLDTAKKLTIPGKQYGFKFINWMPGWIMWLWNNGSDVLSPDGERAAGYFDSPKSVEAMRFLRSLVDEHKVAPSLSEAAAAGVDLFTDGRAAMEISGHWAMVGYAAAKKLAIEDVGVVELPSNTGRSETVMYEAGFAIGKKSRNVEAAWRFVKFMTSRRVQERYQKTGIAVCARRDVALERAEGDPREQAFLAIVPSARPPWGSKVTGYDFVETTGQKAMDNILAGAAIEGSLREAVRRIDGYFRIR